MRTKLATWLLVVLVAGGAVSALAARSRGKTKLQPAAKDSVLQIPRVTRAPELDKYLGSQPTAPGPTAGAEDKKKTKAKGESKARPDSTAAKEKDQADPGAKEGGNTETNPRSDTPSIHLDGVLDSLEKRLHRLESRIDTPATRPEVESSAPDAPAPVHARKSQHASSASSSKASRHRGSTPSGPVPADSVRVRSRVVVAVPPPSVGSTTVESSIAVDPAVDSLSTNAGQGSAAGTDSVLPDSLLVGPLTSEPPPPQTPEILSAEVPPRGTPAPAPGVPSPMKTGMVAWLAVALAGVPLLWTAFGFLRGRRRRAAQDPADDVPERRNPIVVRKATHEELSGVASNAARNDNHRPAKAGPVRTVAAGAGAFAVKNENPRIRQLFFANLFRIKGSLFMAAIFMILGAAVDLLKPWPLKIILDHVILAKPLPHSIRFLEHYATTGFELLLLSAGAIVAISAIGGVFSYLEVFITKAIGYRVVYALRRELFSHLQRLSLSFHNRARTGDLLTTLGKDTSTVKDVFAEALLSFCDHTLSVIGMMVVMWWVSWKMALIALVSLPFLCFTLLHLYRQTKLSLKKQRKQEGRVTSRMNEVLAAVPLVQAFGRERHEEERYEMISNETLKESIRMTRLEAAASRSSQIMTALGTASVVLFGGMEVLQGRMLPGELVLVMTYLSNMYKPLRNLAKLSIDFSKASASAERISEILDVEPAIQDRPDAIEADQIKGGIIFASVSFDYGDGKDVLRRVSFEVGPGQRLALVGVSGAGKSTIASLILRLYEAQNGGILIDGTSIDRYRRESLRRQIGIVLQQSVLFGATIRENIAYGKPDAAPEEIVAAARAANADEFIRELEDGYDSVIGERGVTLSAGQRQRIAIARAVIRDPRILILDEPMTGLDAENEIKVRQALDRLMVGKTTIMITHDLQSIGDTDQVLVVEDGRIVERGTHAELVTRSGRYRRLFELGSHGTAEQVAHS